MRKYRVALIGTGARSCSYGSAYAGHEEIDVVAVADPDPEHRRLMLSVTGLAAACPREYNGVGELAAAHPDLDGVVVATPNALHRESAMPFLERGIAVALEKPIATTMEDAEAILDAIDRYGSRVLIGFVLRSAPFYGKVRELLAADAVGRVLSIQADELASFGVSSIIMRTPWRRFHASGGGSLMEKSSHDMDILNFLSSSRPVALSSFGGTRLFLPDPRLPEWCAECSLGSCPYRGNPIFSSGAGDDILQTFTGDDAKKCIYNIDKDVADNQCVALEFENGAVATFMMSFNCLGPKSERNLHIVGSRGRLWGNLEENLISVYDNETRCQQDFRCVPGEGGHSGGDRAHALELLKMMKNPAYRPAQDAYAGYLSNAMCIAADRSVAERRTIFFQYTAEKRIRLV